jgi:1-deoxy-D-xylulose-5-phosphate synthase
VQVLPVAQAKIVREGKDLTILSAGTMLAEALKAADTLAAEGRSIAVVDCRFVKPLDEATIIARAQQGPILTLEENVLTGGFGAAVVELLEDRGVCSCKLRRLGLPDRFISHGNKQHLWAQTGIDAAGIVAAARVLLG